MSYKIILRLCIISMSLGALVDCVEPKKVIPSDLPIQENRLVEILMSAETAVISGSDALEKLVVQEQVAMQSQECVQIEELHQVGTESIKKEEQVGFDLITQRLDAEKLQQKRLQMAQEYGCVLAEAWKDILKDSSDAQFEKSLREHVAFLDRVIELPQCREVNKNNYQSVMLSSENLPLLRLAVSDMPQVVSKLSAVSAKRLAEVEKDQEIMAAYLKQYHEPLLAFSLALAAEAQQIIVRLEEEAGRVSSLLKESAVDAVDKERGEPASDIMRKIQEN